MEKADNNTEDKLDLIELVNNFWVQRRLFLKAFGWTIIIAIIISFIWPVEYESNTTLLPEAVESNSQFPGSSLLRSLGGFINTENSFEGEISKDLYPEYFKSTPFFLKISKREINLSEIDTAVSVYDYFSSIRKKPLIDYVITYTVGLPGVLLSIPDKMGRGSRTTSDQQSVDISENYEMYRLTYDQLKVQNQIKERIVSNINENGTISIAVKMPDPVAAAQMAQHSVDLLTEFITMYRTEKYKENLEFITGRYQDAKTHFDDAQKKLAEFRDQNANIVSARIQTEQQKLETEFQLAAELYRGMAQQLEQAKINLQEKKPVFTVLEPVQIPNLKSEPNRKLILMVSILLGVVVGFGAIFLKIFYLKLKDRYSNG